MLQLVLFNFGKKLVADISINCDLFKNVNLEKIFIKISELIKNKFIIKLLFLKK
jgi:hypothetical protein